MNPQTLSFSVAFNYSSLARTSRGVLGLTGFFDRFLVAIDDASETVYLEPRF